MTASLLATTLLGASPGTADDSRFFPPPVPTPRAALSVDLVLLKNGRPAQVIPLRGSSIKLPADALGRDYALRVSNRTPGRVAVSIAIDGMSILWPRRIANYESAWRRAPAYIVRPYRTVTLRGWRKNLQSVKAFKITRPQDSVAAQQGAYASIGKLQVVAFAEKQQQHLPLATGGLPGRSKIAKAFGGGVGTGAGKKIEDRTRAVKFQRGRLIYRLRCRYGLDYHAVRPIAHPSKSNAGD